ncbi:SRPBCC family protein [Gottfriedia luciferensis]|uniref:SRPBCC family protein n=1 Tax=Gottfriedia luciferensis TaxID=178774 RepID=UPI000B42D438|nr:SRPBCC family protein [Gottfriedia luciferensis]
METTKKVTVETTIQASVEKVWEFWTEPTHIKKWNSASDDWHTPIAENDLREGGEFRSRMEAKDGSMGFDFGGIYDEVKKHEVIAYTLGDGRKVHITFKGKDDQTEIIETFDAETANPVEFQQQGWQAILNNFKKYAEQNK